MKLKLKLHTQIFIAIAAGVLAGVILGEKAEGVKFVGDVFIRLLRMIIVPLIVASMVSGIISIGTAKSLGRIGFKTFVYYIATTGLSVLVGLILVNVVQPGVGVELASEMTDVTAQTPSILSIIMDIVPKNIFDAMAGDQVLSVIFFSLLLGVAVISVGEQARSIAGFFEGFNAVMMKITDWIMKLAPVGVFALMTYTIGMLGLEVIKPLAVYMATVIGGLLIHAAVTLPVVVWAVARMNPAKFFREMISAVATAFTTASSAATLPITMDCLERRVGVPNRIASFVLPLGATINMDGTALYEAVGAMFIAQAYGIELGLGQQVVIMLTATLASIGAAAIPGAGLITMVIVLKAVNLPVEGIAMILAVDRILDMCRTAVNVWGDSCGAVVVARLESRGLNNVKDG